jgi:predicted nucleotidyltransferase
MESLETNQSRRVPHPCVIELREMLQSVLGENFVRLHHYGSRVVGGADPDSDYDVLCVTRRPLSRHEMDEVMDRRIDLQLDRGVFFDLHFFTSDEIESPPIECLIFLRHATTDGILV